jgi:hypothetical protein
MKRKEAQKKTVIFFDRYVFFLGLVKRLYTSRLSRVIPVQAGTTL